MDKSPEEVAADQAAADSSNKPAAGKKVKARVLVACTHGAPNDVVTLDAAVAKQAEEAGDVDTSKAAVAYAESQLA